jgi:glycosylphosphatidylinositol transamidase
LVRGGAIQAALNLEFREITINKLEVRLEGPNGKLPNLDLFNTVIRVCKSIKFECSLEAEKTNLDFSYQQIRQPSDYKTGFENTVQMIFRQASGLPASMHGYFINHRIEALTLVGSRQSADKSSRRSLKENLLSASRVVEGTLRSINNLLERFHQSFFFYLLPSSNYYISIGVYMPAFGLVGLPLLIEILTIWFSLFSNRPAQLKPELVWHPTK